MQVALQTYLQVSELLQDKQHFSELESAIADFVTDFELVFALDWNFAKETIADELILSNEGTFINPDTTAPFPDWANHEKLLDSYRQLVALLDKRNIHHSYDPD